MNDEKRIRKLYGEKMWHLCRSLFPSLLETEGLLSKLLEDHFNPSRFLYEDIVKNHMEEEFKDYIYSFIDVENENQIITNKSVRELLNDAGYEFYECHTEEEIQSFKKYYAPGEELCTFRGGRLDRCYVFFAVKKDVENINRKNFSTPRREDEYGTSVMSIQFTRGSKNTLSIKNRYNHTVNNPDATFNNNLENITTGLTGAFEREYKLNINQNSKQNFDIPGYVLANDGKWYRYNIEIDNIYYCPDNIIIDKFEVKKDYQEKEKYLLFDCFILDLVNKKIRLYNDYLYDSFVDYNKDIDKIDITNIENGKKITLIFKDGTNAFIIINQYNCMKSYENNYVTSIEGYFLSDSYFLSSIKLPKVTTIGNGFLPDYLDTKKIEIYCPNLLCYAASNLYEYFGHLSPWTYCNNFKFYKYNYSFSNGFRKNVYFCPNNIIIDNGNFVTKYQDKNKYLIFDCFILDLENKELKQYENMETKDSFVDCNKNIEVINIVSNENGKTIELTFKDGTSATIIIDDKNRLISYTNNNVEIIEDNFLHQSEHLENLKLNNVKTIGNNFVNYNWCRLKQISLPKVEIIGDKFMEYNDSLTKFEIPSCIKIGNYCLKNNRELNYFYAPKIEYIGYDFLEQNLELTSLNLPSAKNIQDIFLLVKNKKLKDVYLPNVYLPDEEDFMYIGPYTYKRDEFGHISQLKGRKK